ncbi:MAG: GGDEF domain-containing protein [Sandaracinaceae bacterium]|nr:GGDEF domain-containing protein [Sandaracinaceae bacterium]
MTSRRPGRPSDPISSTLKLDEGIDFHAQVAKTVREQHSPVLVVLSGGDTGVRCRLRGTMLIGRDPDADLTLSDAGVSFRHARIEDRDDAWAIVDLGNTNDTQLNGVASPEFLLHSDDRISFGATQVRFEVQDAVEQAYDAMLDRLINVDELTGLWVRRRFDNELRTLIEGALLKNAPLGLLVMDLDGVKAINDANGHLFGAYVIGEAGRVIGEVIGERGIASRFGGDEYVVAVPGADLNAATVIGEEIRTAINVNAFAHDGIALHPGISIGVASCPMHGTDAETLFRAADEALYRAKQNGKNRVSQ